MFQYPEEPASGDDAGHKPDKAFDAVAELLAHAFFLGDAKDDGSKECKQQCGSEVRKLQMYVHDFFPMAIWCASTAAIMFSSPATIMNFVP